MSATAPTSALIAARDVRFPVTNYMPPEGEEFRFASYVGIPAIGAQANVVQFKVPQGKNGMINYLANEFVGGGFQSGQGNIVWQLYQDLTVSPGGIIVPNFDNILASLGAVNAPSRLNGIRVKENQLVTLVVKNIAIVVAGQQIGGLLGGYFYPTDLEPDNISF